MSQNARQFAAAASVNGNISGRTQINGNTITTFADDANGVSAIGNLNGRVFGGLLNGVGVNDNVISMGGVASIGITVEDNGRGNVSCNEVSSLNTGNGVPVAGSFGMVVNSDRNFNFNCNYLGEVGTGVAIIGENVNADYERFAFHGNTFGLTVGLNTGQSAVTFDEIGDNPNYPAFEYRGAISEDTKHWADASKYRDNEITARANDPLFTPTTGDFPFWFRLIPNNAPAPSCDNCAGFTIPWPFAGECPPATELTAPEWTQLYKTRMLAKSKADSPDDCVIPVNCYTPLAEAEVQFERTLDSFKVNSEALAALSSAMSAEDFNGDISALLLELTDIMEPLQENVEHETELSAIRTSLIEIPTCSEEGSVWKQSLDLSIKAYLPEGLTEEDVAVLTSTAEECSITKGPGVYLARRTLGLASSDAKACVVGIESENLTLAQKEVVAEVYPSPAKAGGMLTTLNNIDNEVFVNSVNGANAIRVTPIGIRNFSLPKNLQAGLYIISYQSEGEVITTKIQVIE